MLTIYRHLRRHLVHYNSVTIGLFIASILFMLAIYINNPILVITNTLYFVIILEVTRMFVEYAKSPDHRVKN